MKNKSILIFKKINSRWGLFIPIKLDHNKIKIRILFKITEKKMVNKIWNFGDLLHQMVA